MNPIIFYVSFERDMEIRRQAELKANRPPRPEPQPAPRRASRLTALLAMLLPGLLH